MNKASILQIEQKVARDGVIDIKYVPVSCKNIPNESLATTTWMIKDKRTFFVWLNILEMQCNAYV